MKKFLERHSAAFLVSAAVLFLTVCVLCACMYYDFRADQELAQSQDYLHTALLKTNVRRLEAALSEENRMTSYHFALTAAENAASAGMGDDALFFSKNFRRDYRWCDQYDRHRRRRWGISGHRQSPAGIHAFL